MKIKYISYAALEYLKKGLQNENKTIVSLFKKENNDELCRHLKNVFDNDSYFIESQIDLPEFSLNPIIKDKLENFKNVYENLKLNPAQAEDCRLWIGLTLFHCWVFAKNAWVNEAKNFTSSVLQHMCGTSKVDVRNAIGRLWWITKYTIDDRPEVLDPYKYTKFIISKTDYISSFLERAYPKNKTLLFAYIDAVMKAQEEGHDISSLNIRVISKYIQALSTVYVLDALEQDELFEKIYKKAKTF